MNKKLIGTLFILLSVLTMGLAQNFTLEGVVKNKQTKQGLKDVNISIPKLKKGCVTDAQGKFSIVLPKGKYKMEIASVGYETKMLTVNTLNPKKVSQIFLNELVTGLGEVSITGTRTQMKKAAQTTTKLNMPLKDVPMTVSSLDRKTIDQLQTTDINEAMRYQTGVKPVSMYGGFQTFKLRGLGRPVIMVDGAVDYRMVFSNSAPVTSLTAVERIEYLKGPASVTHGHSADGGVINIVRKQPTEDFTANFSAYYGSWENKGAVVGAGGKLSDKVNYRFDAGLGDTEGWRDYAQKYANVYGTLDFNFDEKNKLEARFGANKDFYATETGFPVFGTTIFDKKDKEIYHKGDLVKGFDIEQRYNDPMNYLNHKNVNGGLNFIHKFSETSKLTFRGSHTYDYIDYLSTESLSFPTTVNTTKQDDDGNYTFCGGKYVNYFDNVDKENYFLDAKGNKQYIDLNNIIRSYPFRFAHETKTSQASLDYTASLESGSIKHNLLAGYTLMFVDRTTFRTSTKNDITGAGKYAAISIVNPVLNQGNLNEKFSSARIYNEFVNSFYVQDLMDFSEKLKGLIALRLDHYDMDYQSATIQKGKEFSSKTDKINQKQTPLTYRFGLVYEPIEEVSLYASYSSFFRPNRRAYGTDAIYLDEDGNEFNPDFFDPEKGFQAELGVRYAINNRFTLNASAYYINKENIVEYVEQTPAGNPVYAQIGQAESKGVELDFNYQPLAGLNITAGYTFCDAKYTDFSIKKYTAKKKGNYKDRTPKNQFFLWSFYEVQEGVFKNLNLGLGVNYTDKVFTNAANSYELPSYWLTEATVGYKLNNNVYFKFKANNIFNKEYFSNTVMSNQFIPGAERNFLFTVGYKL